MKSNLAEPRKPRRWGFWNRHVIHDGRTIYLDRLSIVTTPLFSIKLHRIYRRDQQRDLHDHPWDFLSIVLWGSYVEDTPTGLKKRRWWNRKRAADRHSIREVSRRPVWTLVVTGPKRREWGFWTSTGWIPWHRYEKLNEA